MSQNLFLKLLVQESVTSFTGKQLRRPILRAPPGMCMREKFLTKFLFVVSIGTASLLEVVFHHFRV